MNLLKDFDSLPCPECGQVVIKKIKTNCTLSDGMFIQELEYFYCSSCHAKFYDDAAVGRIELEGSSIEVVMPA